MSKRRRTTQGELELFNPVSEPKEPAKVQPEISRREWALFDYNHAWEVASFKEDCPNMESFFSSYAYTALGELAEDVIWEILIKQDQLAALYTYLEKQNYRVPAVERFNPASWE